MPLHEANGDDMPDPHYPPEIRTAEGRALYRAMASLGSHVFEAIGGLTAAVARIETRLDKKPPSVPPARPKSDSSLVLLEQVNREIETKLAEEARKTPGSKVEAEPDKIGAMIKGVVADAFAARDNATNARIVDWQRKAALGMLVAFLLAIAGGVGTVVVQTSKARAEGFIEGKHAATSAPAHP
jgi:hypothetical protein